MTKIQSFFEQLTGGKKLLILLSPILTILVSLKLALIGLILIITLDFVTGVRKSLHVAKVKVNPFKKSFWRTITSEGFRQTWRKFTEYGIGIIVLAVLEALFFGAPIITLLEKTFTLTELGVMLAIGIEVYSIFENLYEVNPNSRALGIFAKVVPKIRKYIVDKIVSVF